MPMTETKPAAATPKSITGPQPVLLAIAFMIVVLLSAASVWLVNRSSEDTDAVVRTLDVQNSLSLILLNLRRAESAHRGYIITGQAPYREEYELAVKNTGPALETAIDVVKSNPELQDNFAKVPGLVRAKLGEMARTIALFDAGKMDEARTIVGGGEGRNLMEDVRTTIVGIYNQERQQLDKRRADSERTGQYLLLATMLGSALIILIGGASVYLVQRTSRQRDLAQQELQATNDNLETMIAERTSDLREANDEIQRFAYIISHDLRSPLVNIMGFTAELEALKKDIFDRLAAYRKDDGEEAEKDVETSREFDESLAFIKGSIGKMDRLINSILKLSREGRREFKPEYLSMDDLVKSITDTVAHRADEKGVEITVDSLPAIKSDRLAIEQIFSNLIDNALKYTQPGRPGQVHVRGRADRHQVVYEVEDNGRGIADDDHQRVFELFRRAGQQDQPGEGIGLAHVRALVRRMGGFMTLKSKLGEGTTFIITLPRRMPNEEGQAA